MFKEKWGILNTFEYKYIFYSPPQKDREIINLNEKGFFQNTVSLTANIIEWNEQLRYTSTSFR